MVQDGALKRKLLLLAASAVLLEKEARVSVRCSKVVLFIPADVMLQDLSVKIARGGFKWCSAAAPALPRKPRCSAWPRMGLNGKLSLFAVQHKRVMETTKIRVCYYQFGVANLFFLNMIYIEQI